MTAHARPAQAQGPAAYGRLVVHRGGGGRSEDPSARSRIMVWLLLAAMTMIFASLISAYLVRMDLSDWRPAPLPSLLWLNTALLVGASVALQAGVRPAEQGELARLRPALWIAGALTAAFIAGQLAAWRQMVAMGYGVAATPSSSFFYLFTLIHGLHVLGGLVAWVLLLRRAREAGAGSHRERPARAADSAAGGAGGGIASALRLCALYWHFLLVVWVLLFALMLLT